jgi:hypothetical protein
MRCHEAIEIVSRKGGGCAENEFARVREADVMLDLLDCKFEAK